MNAQSLSKFQNKWLKTAGKPKRYLYEPPIRKFHLSSKLPYIEKENFNCWIEQFNKIPSGTKLPYTVRPWLRYGGTWQPETTYLLSFSRSIKQRYSLGSGGLQLSGKLINKACLYRSEITRFIINLRTILTKREWEKFSYHGTQLPPIHSLKPLKVPGIQLFDFYSFCVCNFHRGITMKVFWHSLCVFYEHFKA